MALGIGCLLGIFVNFGFAALVAYLGWSPWLLLLTAAFATLTSQSFSDRYNRIWLASRRGAAHREILFGYAIPFVIGVAGQMVVYLLVRWMVAP